MVICCLLGIPSVATTREDKTVRSAHNRAEGIPPRHLVRAFAQANRQVLGPRAMNSKSHAMTARPARRPLLLAGGMVTRDAMGCP